MTQQHHSHLTTGENVFAEGRDPHPDEIEARVPPESIPPIETTLIARAQVELLRMLASAAVNQLHGLADDLQSVKLRRET